MNLNKIKLIYEQYQMLHNLAIDTYTNDLFRVDDVVYNFGNLTESVVINIMELLGYNNDEEFAFESINDGIMEGYSFEYLMDLLDSFKLKKEIDSYALKPIEKKVLPESHFKTYEEFDAEEFIRALTTAMFENKGNRIDVRR